MTVRTRIAAAICIVTAMASAGAVRAQFTPPSCVPPNCNPTVIQNIDVAASGQSASINVSGSAKVGGTFQAGSSAPLLAYASENLIYGNVNASSVNASLMLLQFGAADRLRLTLAGQLLLPTGSSGAPAYSFIGDPNTGLYSFGADQLAVGTGGSQRMTWTNTGTTVANGQLSLPTGTAGAPSMTFTGDANMGVYRSAADTLNLATNGVSRLQIDPNGAVTIPGNLTVGGVFTAPGFGGDGSTITNINADNITTGTLNDARLSSNVALLNRSGQAFTGTNTFSNAGNAFTGTFTGSGAAITSLNASNVASGTLADGRLSSNVALYGANGTYTGTNAFTGMNSFGSAALAVGAAQNLIYGNVDTSSSGALMLLQNESVDRFRVSANGNVTAAGSVTAPSGAFSGSLTVGGQNVCRADGTNCQPTLSATGTANYIPKFIGTSSVGNSTVVDVSGNVGIGTATPGSKLHVFGGRTYLNGQSNQPHGSYVAADLVVGDPYTTRGGFNGTNGSHIFLQSLDKSAITALDDNNNLGQISYQNLNWTIGENVGWGVQRVTMPGDATVVGALGAGSVTAGSVAVGTAVPGWQYMVNAETWSADAAGRFFNGSAGGWSGESTALLAQAGNYAVGAGREIAVRADAYTNANNAYAIYASANCLSCGNPVYGIYISSGLAAKPGGGSWSGTSDRRVKEDIIPFTDGLDIIRQVNPVHYTYNGLGEMPKGHKGVGVIAQDLQKVAPSMVMKEPRKLHPEDAEDTEILMVDPSDFTYISLNAIKQLDLRIDETGKAQAAKDGEQDRRIQELERDVEELRAELKALQR